MEKNTLNLEANNDYDSASTVTSSTSFKNTSEINSPLTKKSTSPSSLLVLSNAYLLLIGKSESLYHEVVYTDYIGERIGSIRDYYSLLCPPIGKG